MTEGQQAAIREMVKEIGSEPQQDMHFDIWHYSDQPRAVFGMQSYEQAVIRKYTRLKFGDNATPAQIEPLNALMAAVQA